MSERSVYLRRKRAMNTPNQPLTGKERSPQSFAWTSIDTLYDYVAFLQAGHQGGNDIPIAVLPEHLWNKPVAIVGAGIAGLVAAYELLKIGAAPVIFEADAQRIGGRAYAMPFTEASGVPSQEVFAEMGAMRFPSSGRLFFHYLSDIFALPVGTIFPDPGRVPTRLLYQNNIVDWPASQTAPCGFESLVSDWVSFMGCLVSPLFDAHARQDIDQVIALWQSMIDAYKDLSFYTAVHQGIPHWTDDDLQKFGALGIGTGGFGPLYQSNFLEILRILVNRWEQDQRFLPNGSNAFVNAFYTHPVRFPDNQLVSLQLRQAVRLHSPVFEVGMGSDGDPYIVYREAKTSHLRRRSFPAVIVTTTTSAMQVMGLSMTTSSPAQSVLDGPVKSAIRLLHQVNASKLFIRTATKFWKDDPSLPQAILMDDLPRNVYALDYPQTEQGVILMSYTWEDDSNKLVGLTREERFALFRRAIAHVCPRFARHLEPINGEILIIDWQAAPYYGGAFKLHTAGQEPYAHAAYFQFQSVLDTTTDRGVYLAGDSVSWAGGWIEGALQTGLNAACAAAKRIGAEVRPDSPFNQDPGLYNYSAT